MSRPTVRVVVDSGVLVEDAKKEKSAKIVMDIIRKSPEMVIIASMPLLDEAQKVIETDLGGELADRWREDIESICEIVDHLEEDHPALASAYVGNAQHIISRDERLTNAKAGVAIRTKIETSVKRPDAFVKLFENII
tara:strand:+ start:894 stop:1304 length:411 start_codon:yes stop_codon:yes gene_type:complete